LEAWGPVHELDYVVGLHRDHRRRWDRLVAEHLDHPLAVPTRDFDEEGARMTDLERPVAVRPVDHELTLLARKGTGSRTEHRLRVKPSGI
jgi:hypothetical protein